MTPPLTISRLPTPDVSVAVPGSKSETNRALVCAALAGGTSILRNPSFSDDSLLMVKALDALGIRVEGDPSGRELRVRGTGGKIPVRAAALSCGNAGTTLRFSTALCALGDGEYLIDGDERMRARPIQDLLDALTLLGVRATSLHGNDCPPVRVATRGIEGGDAVLAGDTSSQFLTALLLVSPHARRSVNLRIESGLVSKPYVDLTERVMGAFGVPIVRAGYVHFSVRANQSYRGLAYSVEPDASSAGYFWAIAAVTGGRIRVNGLGASCAQADVALLDRLSDMGCAVTRNGDGSEVRGARPLRGIETTMTDCPDAVPTLAAVALFAEGPTTIRGVAHLRDKESDRLAAIAAEWGKLGARVEVFDDGLRIEPGPLRPATLSTHDDHRIAMSAAVIGAGAGGVTIENPDCVAKSFPGFFEVLGRLRNGA
ncbi:MAG: 3-phosphoshikimate 1-carboxyvinyltransferase [Planctomycetes bacterium]|nr:3-phosphoshikimate 1-carboxyvinyltransferase [Planctomycetota bacterium]